MAFRERERRNEELHNYVMRVYAEQGNANRHNIINAEDTVATYTQDKEEKWHTTRPHDLCLAMFSLLKENRMLCVIKNVNNVLSGEVTLEVSGPKASMKDLYKDSIRLAKSIRDNTKAKRKLVSHLLSETIVKIRTEIKYATEVSDIEDQCSLCESDFGKKVYVLKPDNKEIIILCSRCGKTMETWNMLDIISESRTDKESVFYSPNWLK